MLALQAKCRFPKLCDEMRCDAIGCVSQAMNAVYAHHVCVPLRSSLYPIVRQCVRGYMCTKLCMYVCMYVCVCVCV